MKNSLYKFIYIHIPKTGGSSVSNVLESLSGSEKMKGHPLLARYMQEKDYKNYYKFCFVRNPWDRLVSAFFFLRKGGNNIFDQKHCDKLKLKETTFKDFAKKLNPNKKYPKHFLNQYAFIKDDEKNIKFFKFENINSHFNVACDAIGFPRTRLPHSNKSKHKHYTQYYDSETREIIAEKYAKDIEYFGYEFGE